MKALIADDEPALAQHLRKRLERLWPELDVAAMAANGIEALDMVESLHPDVAFLDIRMPGLSGLEVAQQLSPPARAACRLVFVTAYDEFAVEAFEREAVDYLLKPVNDERLAATVERLKRSTREPQTDDLLQRLRALMPRPPGQLAWVRASVGSEVRLVAVADVCYFQATDKYTAVFTRDAELLIRTPIKELAEQLDPAMFQQVHRATLVNLQQVVAARHDALGRVSLRLRDRGEAIAVSRAYAPLFRQM